MDGVSGQHGAHAQSHVIGAIRQGAENVIARPRSMAARNAKERKTKFESAIQEGGVQVSASICSNSVAFYKSLCLRL